MKSILNDIFDRQTKGRRSTGVMGVKSAFFMLSSDVVFLNFLLTFVLLSLDLLLSSGIHHLPRNATMGGSIYL